MDRLSAFPPALGTLSNFTVLLVFLPLKSDEDGRREIAPGKHPQGALRLLADHVPGSLLGLMLEHWGEETLGTKAWSSGPLTHNPLAVPESISRTCSALSPNLLFRGKLSP